LYPSLLRRSWEAESVDAKLEIRHRNSDENSPLLNVADTYADVANPQLPTDETLVALLRELRLGHLLDAPVVVNDDTVLSVDNHQLGLDAIRDWTAVLSSGEQQRIAFARLLVHKWVWCLLSDFCAQNFFPEFVPPQPQT
jgi:hypothetical protein